MRPLAVINPMKSCRPTGIGIAGDSIADILTGEDVVVSRKLDRLFMMINDRCVAGMVRAWLRLLLVQFTPFLFPSDTRLLFTSHHAPLWRTGRHAMILHDTIPLEFPSQALAQSFYYRRGLHRAVSCAYRIITISSTVRDDFINRSYKAVSNAAIIPSFSPLIASRPLPVGYRAKHELLVVGARYPHKNLNTVLEALEILNRTPSSPWRLTIAGVDRRLWARAWGGLKYFERLGWIRVIERVGADELTGLYARATALVFPSLAEGQGLPPLEAMAFGCPVLCSDLPSQRETCGDAAYYFPATDAAALASLIKETLGGSDTRLGEAGRTRLAMFSRDAVAAKWRKFLEAWP